MEKADKKLSFSNHISRGFKSGPKQNKHPNSKNVRVTCQTVVRAAQARSLLLRWCYLAIET